MVHLNYRKRMKGLLAVAIAIAFVISGCSSNNGAASSSEPAPSGSASQAQPTNSAEPSPSELPPVELSWYYGVGAIQPDQQEVEDAVNQYLKENTKLNATVKLYAYDFGSYDQKMNTKVAANENMDILWTTAGWTLIYSQNVAKGAFLALDELLPEYAPHIYNEMMPKPFWEDVKYPEDQKIYAIPNYQVAATASGFVFRKDLVDKYDFDITTVKKTADLEPFLKALKENEPNVIPLAFQYKNGPDFDNDYRYFEWVWYDKNDPFTPVDIVRTPERQAYWELMHDWYEKGYVYKELATVKDFSALMQTGKVAVTTDVTFKPGGEVELKQANGGHDVVRQQITDVAFTGVTATMNAISRTSKHPERALMFLDLVNSDKTLYQLLCYGIQGKHYNEVDGYYQPIEGSGYNPGVDWVFGNQFNGLLREGQPKDLWEQTKKLNESAQLSPLYGFKFNPETIKTENAAMNSVEDEYRKMLDFGVADPQKILPKYLEALDKAGQAKVNAEIKKQFDEWKAANGK